MTVLIDPTGKYRRIKDLKKFAKENGMSVHSLYGLSCGRNYSIKGWISTKHPRRKKLTEWHNREIIHRDTKEICKVGKSHVQLANRLGILQHHMSQLLNGKYLQYNGWLLKKTYDELYK